MDAMSVPWANHFCLTVISKLLSHTLRGIGALNISLVVQWGPWSVVHDLADWILMADEQRAAGSSISRRDATMIVREGMRPGISSGVCVSFLKATSRRP